MIFNQRADAVRQPEKTPSRGENRGGVWQICRIFGGG